MISLWTILNMINGANIWLAFKRIWCQLWYCVRLGLWNGQYYGTVGRQGLRYDWRGLLPGNA